MFEGDFRMKQRRSRGLIFHFQEITRFNMKRRRWWRRRRGERGGRRDEDEMRISDG